MKKKPIRMCIVCKKRDFQKNLIRLQCKETLTLFTGSGRSFYVCNECITKKKFKKYIANLCKTSINEIEKRIKEFT